MEDMKKKLKQKRNLFITDFIFIIAIGIRCGYEIISGMEREHMTNSIVIGYQMGLILGLGMLLLVNIIKLSMVLKDEKKTKVYFNQINDERLKTIRSKAGMPLLLYTSIIMLAAAIIAGYFNEIIFYTLVITAMVQLTIGVVIKLYYMKTM